MTTMNLTAKETLAVDWYFFKLDLLLAGMPNKHVKDIKKELKADLYSAAAETSVGQALQNFGPVNALASNYLEAYERPVPRIWAGIVAFAVLLYSWLLGVISLLEGLHDMATALKVTESQTVTSNWLLVTGYAEVTPTGVESFGFELQGPNLFIFLAILIVVPLVCARIWRAWKK